MKTERMRNIIIIALMIRKMARPRLIVLVVGTALQESLLLQVRVLCR